MNLLHHDLLGLAVDNDNVHTLLESVHAATIDAVDSFDLASLLGLADTSGGLVLTLCAEVLQAPVGERYPVVSLASEVASTEAQFAIAAYIAVELIVVELTLTTIVECEAVVREVVDFVNANIADGVVNLSP